MAKRWKVYLSGEIHSDWRDRIVSAAVEKELPVSFTAPVTDHAASDNCGVDILGPEASGFWKDHKGAKINAIRTRTLISDADVVVVRFGGTYRQWNAAFDAGFAGGAGQADRRDARRRHRPRAQGSRLGGDGGWHRRPNR